MPSGSSAVEPVPGPSTTRDIDDSPPPRRPRGRKRVRPVTPPDDSSSSGDEDAGNLWKNVSEPDEEPLRRPFTPQHDPGFQLPRNQNWTPFSLFSLFFSQSSIDVIVANTNKYANKIKADKSYFRWFRLSAKEFLAFIGIIIFMGLVEVPTLTEYWNDDGFFGQDFVPSSGMNRARFMNILTALHLCDFEQDRQNEMKKARKEPYDPLFKLKPFMNDLQLVCKAYFVPG